MYAGLRFYPSKTYTCKARPAISVQDRCHVVEVMAVEGPHGSAMEQL